MYFNTALIVLEHKYKYCRTGILERASQFDHNAECVVPKVVKYPFFEREAAAVAHTM